MTKFAISALWSGSADVTSEPLDGKGGDRSFTGSVEVWGRQTKRHLRSASSSHSLTCHTRKPGSTTESQKPREKGEGRGGGVGKSEDGQGVGSNRIIAAPRS